MPPPVAIEKFKADGRSFLETDAVNKLLRPHAKILQFEYTALSLTAPERVRFRYRLEGFDPEWSAPVTSRQATYTNLPPRAYRFRVIACNNDGVWNEAGASLNFSIPPAFYQTNWFWTLCGLLFIAAIFAVHRFNSRRFRARAEELSRVVDERTKDLQEEIRVRQQAEE